MNVTLRMQKTKDLVNNPISDEAMELIGPRGTGKVFIGFEEYMTQAPLRNGLKQPVSQNISLSIAPDIHSGHYRLKPEHPFIQSNTCGNKRM